MAKDSLFWLPGTGCASTAVDPNSKLPFQKNLQFSHCAHLPPINSSTKKPNFIPTPSSTSLCKGRLARSFAGPQYSKDAGNKEENYARNKERGNGVRKRTELR